MNAFAVEHNRRTSKQGALLLAAAVLSACIVAPAHAQWTQWGGPNQDWKCDSKGLADKWPEDGPKKLWARDLGEGYSSIAVDGDTCYTMYRSEDKAHVIALKADTGATVWEYSYEEDPAEGHEKRFGNGPRSTPLVVGDRLFTIGVRGIMHCLDKNAGKVLWSHDLWKDFNGYFLNHGYSSGVFPYKDTVITLVGGEGNAMIAFNQADGSVAWKANDFGNSYSTPKLINVDGQEQLLCYMAQELTAIDPNNGKELWSYKIGNQWGQNVCLPVWGDDNTLFLSSVEAGSRGIKLTRNGDKTDVEELWSTRKVQLYHVTAVGLGDWVYGSSGSGAGGPCFYSCINRKTGKVAWRERGLAKATTLFADDKFIILDEDGKFVLAKASPEKFEILSEVQLVDKVAWTVPVLVGNRCYVRDQKQIMALDLS